MSEETRTGEDGQEPSMEDILASIRRILSENDEAKIAAVEAELHPEGLSSNEVTEEGAEAGSSEGNDPGVQESLDAETDSVSKTTMEGGADSEKDGTLTSPESHTSIPPVMEAILDLTPEMIASEIISEPTAQTSTDVLSQLASAILDRRDMAVDASSQDMTLEGIVREMLKPILREWLDRNLPYLIERLVKREIDLMVNRAERLEE